MRHFRIILFLLLTALGAEAQTLPQSNMQQSSAPAQATPSTLGGNEDWTHVRELTHDEEIIVSASHSRRVRCLFTGATDEFLFCEPQVMRQGAGEYRFDRADVEKIRLEQGERNFKLAIAIPAAAGFVWGFAAGSNPAGVRLLTGLAGALAGSMVGLVAAAPVAIFVPGHLVYQRPHGVRKSRTATHLRLR
jgi:hypothetical protein